MVPSVLLCLASLFVGPTVAQFDSIGVDPFAPPPLPTGSATGDDFALVGASESDPDGLVSAGAQLYEDATYQFMYHGISVLLVALNTTVFNQPKTSWVDGAVRNKIVIFVYEVDEIMERFFNSTIKHSGESLNRVNRCVMATTQTMGHFFLTFNHLKECTLTNNPVVVPDITLLDKISGSSAGLGFFGNTATFYYDIEQFQPEFFALYNNCLKMILEFGGAVQSIVEVLYDLYHDKRISMQKRDDLCKKIFKFIKEGFRHINLYLKTGNLTELDTAVKFANKNAILLNKLQAIATACNPSGLEIDLEKLTPPGAESLVV